MNPVTAVRPAPGTAGSPISPPSLDLTAQPVRDRGRLVAAVTFTVFAMFGALRLAALATGEGLTGSRVAPMVGAALVLVFNLLMVSAWLTRPPATARSGSRLAHAAAVVATWSSIATAFFVTNTASGAIAVVADGLQLAGLLWSVWALRTLGRSFSILAEARAVVERGPYRWVRHPLYVGEVISVAGLVLHGPTVVSVGCLLGLVVLQVYRATKEEAVLTEALDDYAGYQARTARLVPGVF